MIKTNQRFALALLSATALTVGSLGFSAAPAVAGSIKNSKPVELTIGGQVNRAFLYVNDGEEGMYRHVDNENNSTRIFLDASGKVNETWSLGSSLVMKMRSNPSNNMSATTENSGTGNFEEEVAEIFFTHSQFGTLRLGQGDTATNGISEVDLSGTGVAGYSSIGDVAGGFAFVNSGPAPGRPPPSVTRPTTWTVWIPPIASATTRRRSTASACRPACWPAVPSTPR
tara:strand:- start:38 stop:718 length:681 start_codon:yes stop_codon:yes gene_type:complete